MKNLVVELMDMDFEDQRVLCSKEAMRSNLNFKKLSWL